MATSDVCTGSSDPVMDHVRTNCKPELPEKEVIINKNGPPKKAKPKSPKVLVRKNTPAELPTISKIYAMDQKNRPSPLVEEDVSEVNEDSDVTQPPENLASPKNLSGVNIIISDESVTTT